MELEVEKQLYEKNAILLIDGIGTQFFSALFDDNGIDVSFRIDDADFLNYKVATYSFYALREAAADGMFYPNQYTITAIFPRPAGRDFTESLKNALENAKLKLTEHILKGGTFTLITRFGTIAGCVINGKISIDTTIFDDVKQPVCGLVIPFQQPLIYLDDAQAAYNQSMSRMSLNLPPANLSSTDSIKAIN